MTPAIRVENLGKSYRVNHAEQRLPYKTLRDSLTRIATSPVRRWRAGGHAGVVEQFWALKEVNFEVYPGEVVGIIGRNGAGKSTLLKVLSRITTPSTGRVEIRGRVGSLLEVGTGFHPELTGRENILLNGAILGMSRHEVYLNFNDIVSFAEVEKFIDMPVKRYSSGMYLRLAFSVAAYLQPDILIVDEVLAVGDASFQTKCLEKMGNVARDGRTVLLVSHNLVAVEEMCCKCNWIDNGSIKASGDSREVIGKYSAAVNRVRSGDFNTRSIKGDGRVKLLSYQVTNASGRQIPLPTTHEDVLIQVRVRLEELIVRPAVGISVRNSSGVLLTAVNTVEMGLQMPSMPAGEVQITVRLKHVAFLPGSYIASFWVMNPQCHIYAMAENSIAFEIGHTPLYGTSQVDHRWGCVYTSIGISCEPVP